METCPPQSRDFTSDHSIYRNYKMKTFIRRPFEITTASMICCPKCVHCLPSNLLFVQHICFSWLNISIPFIGHGILTTGTWAHRLRAQCGKYLRILDSPKELSENKGTLQRPHLKFHAALRHAQFLAWNFLKLLASSTAWLVYYRMSQEGTGWGTASVLMVWISKHKGSGPCSENSCPIKPLQVLSQPRSREPGPGQSSASLGPDTSLPYLAPLSWNTKAFPSCLQILSQEVDFIKSPGGKKKSDPDSLSGTIWWGRT